MRFGPRAGVGAELAVAAVPDRRPLAEEDIFVDGVGFVRKIVHVYLRDATQ